MIGGTAKVGIMTNINFQWRTPISSIWVERKEPMKCGNIYGSTGFNWKLSDWWKWMAISTEFKQYQWKRNFPLCQTYRSTPFRFFWEMGCHAGAESLEAWKDRPASSNVCFLGPLLLTWLNLIPGWISYRMATKILDEITYLGMDK